jgi:hypothetical protein
MTTVLINLTHGDHHHLFHPVDLTIKRNGPMSGLCNQLFRIINALARYGSNTLVLDVMTKDFFTGEVLPTSELVDLDQMNYMYQLDLNDITKFKPTAFQWDNDGYIFRAWEQERPKFIEYARKLIFSDRIRGTGALLVQNFELVGKSANLVHLRLEEDIMAHINDSVQFENCVNKYYELITTNCNRGKPLVVLTGNDQHPIMSKLRAEYNVVFVSSEKALEVLNRNESNPLDGREILGLCDFAFAQNLIVDNLVYMNGSSFSILLKTLVPHRKGFAVM